MIINAVYSRQTLFLYMQIIIFYYYYPANAAGKPAIAPPPVGEAGQVAVPLGGRRGLHMSGGWAGLWGTEEAGGGSLATSRWPAWLGVRVGWGWGDTLTSKKIHGIDKNFN